MKKLMRQTSIEERKEYRKMDECICMHACMHGQSEGRKEGKRKEVGTEEWREEMDK